MALNGARAGGSEFLKPPLKKSSRGPKNAQARFFQRLCFVLPSVLSLPGSL